MDYDQIEAAALALDTQDRLDLLEAITDSLWAEVKRKGDPRPVVAAVEAAAGQNLQVTSRHHTQVAMRCAIAYRLRHELDLPYSDIGTALARDHSTAVYYCERMADALTMPAMWPEYIELYNKSKTL